MNTFAQVH